MKNRSIASLSLPVLLFAVAHCGGASAPAAAPGGAITPTSGASLASEKLGVYGVDEGAIDPSVSPCDDFYAHACGTWAKGTPIPDDQAMWMRGFDVLHEQNETKLREILEADAAGPGGTTTAANGAYAKELGDFYAACMDEKKIEDAGLAPLKPELDRIAKVADVRSFTKAIAHLHAIGVQPLFGFTSGQDFKDAEQVIGIAEQGGLGLPDREYYLSDAPKMKEIRGKYEAHVARMFQLLGQTPAEAKESAQRVLRIEHRLAEGSMSKVDQRDPKKIYHRIDLAGLKEIAPTFGWDAYLADLGVPKVTAINVAEPEFFKTVDAMLGAATTPPAPVTKSKSKSNATAPTADRFDARGMRTYLTWHLVRAEARWMPAKFVDEAFTMRHALTGVQKDLPRWKRCVRAADGAMGEALAQPFVKTSLGAEGKATAQSLIGEIEAAMKSNLDQLAWMDADTRGRALDKLGRITNKVAYPDKWRKYDGLAVTRATHLANVENAEAFEVKRQLAKIGKPVDHAEWEMTPPTVNAYYEPTLNEMVFPAGILQPPFFNAGDLPVNYGGIGLVMGHELTHGFDDEGRQFDGHGNLVDWWTAPVSAEFDKRAACVASQFDGYVAVDDLHVNGKLTLGENIADLGGLKLAYAAFKKHAPNASRAAEQAFFYGHAQAWCGNVRAETLRMLVATNPHSPPRFRVNGPISNIPEFGQAFACKVGSPMVAEKNRCEVW